MFGLEGKIARDRLALVRTYAAEAFREALPRRFAHPRQAIGSGGTINAVVAFAASKGARRASRRELQRAVDRLAALSAAAGRRHFEPRRAEIIVAGAVILEAAVVQLGLDAVQAVDTGLRNGVLVDLLRRTAPSADDRSAAEAALALGRRFDFDEPHGLHVGALAVTLFEDLAPLHGLPFGARRVLEAAAVLHDVGNAVSFHRHHKHTQYLVANADMPGFANRERELVALVARYHRRSHPDPHRADLAHLRPAELVLVRRLVAILRVANALDASHQQHVRSLRAAARGPVVTVTLRARGALDLELWDAAREARFFQEVFRKRLELVVGR
jgi:exopolyphosphatase/guanosine-5'-triphosphate,3'-diphosphate pyrophosphatase